MALWHEVDEDDSFTPESDPALRKLIKREASAAVMQDISLNTYWANTVGKTKYPGNYQLYLKELRENMLNLLQTKMTYLEVEEFMGVLGYEAGDIRDVFTSVTGIDPVKMEYMRQEDLNNTPGNIPAYTLGWGCAKKKSAGEAYFIMPTHSGLYSVFLQKDDMNRSEVASFLTQEEACEYVSPLVDTLHRYDKPAAEAAAAFMDIHEESTKPAYVAMANRYYDMQRRGELDPSVATKEIQDSYKSGYLDEREARDLHRLYVQAAPPVDTTNPSHATETHEMGPKETPQLDYRQRTDDVKDELERNTPQDFFENVLPDRMDTITPQHVKDVLGYIAHRGKDLSEFEIKLHSLEYMKHETPKALVETNPENGRPAGPPRATVSVILEICDRTLPEEHSRKYALAVFFVNPDGEIGTSDSVKGEDDIIYGFSEDGLRQYFSRDRLVRGQA